MSETNNKKDGTGGTKGKKKLTGKRPFNPYWIYVIIAVVLISQLLFSFSSGTKSVERKEFV